MSDPHAPPPLPAGEPPAAEEPTADLTFPGPATAAGPLPSLLLTVGVLLAFLLLQTAAMLVLLVAYASARGEPSADVGTLLSGNMGWSFSLATLLTAPPAVALAAGGLYLLAGRHGGAPLAAVHRHLGLGLPRWPPFVLWALATAAYVRLYDVAGRYFDRPPLPQFMIDFHASAGSVWLLGAAVVVAAPLVEEILFRGVLLPGFAVTPRGRVAGLLVSAAVWAAIHAQYDVYDMSGIFLLGLLFGAARLHSRSLWTPLVLHAGFNLYAVLQLLDLLGPIS